VSFLNSLFLLGLAAAVLPVLIHLLSRQKAKRLLFGSVQFIRRLEERRRRRFRVTQWLLLALRVLLLALVALAFARPTLRSALFGEGGGRTAAVIVLDASASMGPAVDGASAFEAARRRALEVVDLLGDEDESALLLASTLPRAAASAAAPALTRTRDLLREEIARAAPTAAASDLAGPVRDAVGLLADARSPNREIYVISDFQRCAVPEAGLRAALPPGTRAYLLPVGAPSDGNAAVTAVSWREPRVGSGDVRVEAQITRFGGHGSLETIATLLIDGVERERRLVALEPGEAHSVAFTARLEGRGDHVAAVTIDARDVAIDNERPFVVALSEGMRVLVVDGRGPRETGSAYHVARALAPDAEAAGFFRVTRAGAAEGGLPDLAPFGAIVLADVGRLAQGDLERLGDAVDRGSGVLVIPGRTLDATFASRELLPRLGLSVRIEAQPVEFQGSFARIDQIDGGHAIFAPFGESRGRLFRDTRVVRYFAARTGEHARVLARFGDGAAALVEAQREGGGRALLATFPIDPEWTTLPHDPVFVPILHEAIKYLARVESAESANLIVGESYRSALSELPEGGAVVAIAPDGTETLVSPRAGADGLVAEVRDTPQVGAYTLRTTAGERRFAVGVSPVESDAARLSPSEIAASLEGAEVVAPDAEIRRAVMAGRFGKEYWREILALALVVAVVEALVGRGASGRAAGGSEEKRAA
jgi:hypothetical protein